jgi:hypothetical protein
LPRKAAGDQSLDEIRELARDHADRPSAQGEPSIRWAYEIVVPAVVGAVLMAVLVVIG